MMILQQWNGITSRLQDDGKYSGWKISNTIKEMMDAKIIKYDAEGNIAWYSRVQDREILK